MTEGRTYWWAKDAAWYDRERVADLSLMYGPTGVAVLDWLCCHAKALNDGGVIKTGFSAVTKGIGGKLDEVTAAVRYAAEIGALDDFDEDGKRFTARISGWASDQDRALSAVRQAKWRARNAASRPVTPNNEDSDRTEVKDEANASPSVSDEVVGLCVELANCILAADPKAKTAEGSATWQRDMRLLVERDKRTVAEVSAVITYIFDEGFWVPMIRSPAALRRRFDQIAAQAARRPNKKISHVEDSFPNAVQEAAQLAAMEDRVAGRTVRLAGSHNDKENA